MQWQQQAGQQNPAVSPSRVGTTRQGEEAPRHPIREDPVHPQRGQGLRGLVIRFQKGDAYEILATVEKAVVEICDEELAEQFDEEDVQGHSAEVYDVLRREALQLVRTLENMEGFRAWSKMYQKYALKMMARTIWMVGQVTNLPKVKELRDVDRELMKWEEKAKALTTEFRRDLQRHGKGWDRRLDHAPGRSGTRVPLDWRQGGLRRGEGQDPVRRVQ